MLKKNLSKVFLLLVALMTLIGFTGCGSSSNDDGTSSEKVKIQIQEYYLLVKRLENLLIL